MKIILTKDVDKLGGFGDIVNVKDGYAKNYLIPNGLAIFATPGNIKQSEILTKSRIKVEAKNIKEATDIAGELEGTKLIFKVKSSSEGKLYGSITNKDIAEKILSFKKIEIDRKKIELEDSLKETGAYELEIKLYKDIKCNITVSIETDKKQTEGESAESAATEISANENAATETSAE